MAAIAGRSMLRSPSLRVAASRVSSATTASRPSLRRLPYPRPPAAARFLRSPVEMSFCLESLMPMHSATASAVMTSMLRVSRHRHGWLSDASDESDVPVGGGREAVP